jgi:neutral ceramidase
VSGLANSLVSGEAAKTNIPYDDWRGKSVETALYAGPRQTLTDDKALGDRFSERLDDKVEYGRGEAVQARFWSHDPTANFRTGNNFLKVQQKKQAGWKTVATDSDWSTTVRWQAKDQGMIATLTWHIDANVENGEYRLMHLGRGPQGNPFKGYSRTIQIK